MASKQLLRSTPEEQGVSSVGIKKFVTEVDRKIHEMHSFMLLRHGAVVAEGWWAPYSAERVHVLFSLTKSFTSTAVGLAAAEGKLKVDDKVLSFFLDEAPAKPDENLKAMRVRHLLSMSTGHSEDTTGRMTMRSDGDWVKGFLSLPVENEPGSPFVYNSGASYMLSAIVQKLTGMKLEDYLKPRLFEPLGIEKWNWETCPKGINIGGWGLAVTTEAIARFGQLYLQKGMWEGKRIIPEAWVEVATAKRVSNDSGKPDQPIDWAQGYGYQFWRCQHGAYRGDGAFGQYCIVMPEQEAVLAITSAVDEMQDTLNMVWKHLLPAFGKEKLAADPAAHKALSKKCASLAHKPPSGLSQPALASQVSGKTFTFESNAHKIKSIQFDFTGDDCQLMLKSGRRTYRLVLREGAWSEGLVPGFGYPAVPVVVSGTWQGEEAYQMTLRFIETPATQTMTCLFGDGKVTIDGAMNVSFGPKELPQLVGKMG
jgi:CubicO group peptidase (beta-lactamase class C family)